MSSSKLQLSACWKVIICSLLSYAPMADTIDCTIQQCQNTIIDCLPSEDCYVSCSEPQSCITSIINCPLNGNCDILCSNGQSCQDTVINASSSNGNFNLFCEHSTDNCKGITIYGSILPSNLGNFSVFCEGKMRACLHSQIYCPVTGDCTIECNGDTSCRWAHIYGPSIDGDLNIECNSVKSCSNAEFDGKTSSTLDITGCTSFESCSHLTLYCPPNTNGIKHCFIEGDNSMNRDNNGESTIYAIHGFDDIEINYSGTTADDTRYGGQMVCGDHYDISCNLKSDDYSCADSNICNFHTHPPATPAIYNSTSLHTSISPTLSTSVTMLYTSTYHVDHPHADDYETHDSQDGYDDSQDVVYYELSRDRGVTWLLEVRVIFGIAVLLTIIIVAVCCYVSNRKHTHYTKAHSHQSHDAPRYYSRTYTHHSYDDGHGCIHDDYSKTLEIDDTFQLNNLCTINDIDILSPKASCTIAITPRPRGQSLTPHNSMQTNNAACTMPLNSIQAEIVAVRQLLTLRKLVSQRKDDAQDSDASDLACADTNDLLQRNNKFISKTYASGEDSPSPSLSPKTPVLSHHMKSTMSIFNLNDDKKMERNASPSPRRSMHQRTKVVDIKPDIVSKIVSKFNKSEIQRKNKKKKSKSLSNKKISVLQCPKQKSLSRKKKSPSSISNRKGTLISLTQKSDYCSTNVNESETDIDSQSESNDKTKTENMPSSTLEDNLYTDTSTYDPSDPIPTAC